MKKQLYSIVILISAFILGQNKTLAQAELNKIASTPVSLSLSDVLSIDAVSNAQVNFIYNTADDYNTDQEHIVQNNLTVTSSGSFDIKAEAIGNHFMITNGNTGGNNSNKIKVGVLEIEAVAGGTMGGQYKRIEQTKTNSQTLVNNASSGATQTLDIKYSIPAKEARKFVKLLNNTYTQQVKYTAVAR